MKKNKYIDEIEELHTSDVAQNERLRKKQNSRKTLRSALIVILSILCVTGVVLIQKLHTDAETTTANRARFSRMTAQKIPLSSNSISLSADTMNHMPVLEPKPILTEDLIKTTVEKPLLRADMPKETEKSDSDKEVKPVEIQKPMIQENPKPVMQKKVQKPNYSLKEALNFKEHFIKGLSCKADYQKLLQVNPKTHIIQSVLDNLSPYCTGKADMIENMREAFLKDKKQALIAEYRIKETWWISYMKAMLVSAIEIRSLNPNTSRPKDIIYKAQNELYRQNVEQTLELLHTLSPVIQEKMADFFREADLYIRADNSLNELILSFDESGE